MKSYVEQLYAARYLTVVCKEKDENLSVVSKQKDNVELELNMMITNLKIQKREVMGQSQEHDAHAAELAVSCTCSSNSNLIEDHSDVFAVSAGLVCAERKRREGVKEKERGWEIEMQGKSKIENQQFAFAGCSRKDGWKGSQRGNRSYAGAL